LASNFSPFLQLFSIIPSLSLVSLRPLLLGISPFV
jgi:hypothetical protein